MQNIQLPKLEKFNPNKVKKPKILLLSDDLRMHSGIATMSREMVIGSANVFDWVQLGAALKHPDHGKVFDISQDVNKEAGISDASVKVYAHTGYGSQDVVREIIDVERPDAILHFTDPRFWGWLYAMEHELRSQFEIPIFYYAIWDAPPAPFWNEPFYKSCDLVMGISKQSHNLHKMVIGEDCYHDLDNNTGRGSLYVSYVPHGINSKYYYPIDEKHQEWPELQKLSEKFKSGHDVDFIFFWNNRNIRRKMPGDLILSYRKFCDMLPPEKAKRVALFMHTNMKDENGTDIPEVARVLCPDYKVIFNEERLPVQALNLFYNMADVTINIASNEGFGLSSAESLMTGTPILNNVTGGLQDQCRFEDDDGKWIDFTPEFTSNHTGRYKKHGSWAKVVYPSNRSLQGSVITPYIFDDRCDFNDVAEQMLAWYNTTPEKRKKVGQKGREWVLSEESGMSAENMCARMIDAMSYVLENWKPKAKFSIHKIVDRKKITNPGVVW